MSTTVIDEKGRPQNEGSWVSWADFLGTAGQGGTWSKKTLLNFLQQYREQIVMAESAELLILLTNAGLEYRINQDDDFKGLLANEEGSEDREEAVNNLIERFGGEVEEEKDEELDGEVEEGDDIMTEVDVTDEEDIEEEDVVGLPPEAIMGSFKLYDHEYIHMENLDQEKIQFLIQNRINKMWNHYLNDRIDIHHIENEEGGEYFTEIKNSFLAEHAKVVSIKNPEGYCFEHEPMLMQKLVAYRLKNKRVYGNWSTVGAGKTLAGVYAGRYAGAKNTIIVTYNSTIKGWVKSLNSYFDDCTIYEKKIKGVKLDDNKNNYIILNYEFFQQGKRSENYLYEFMENNRIDYVILDEVHSVKQRKEDTSLNTEEMVEEGFLSSRRRLMMKFLNDVRDENPSVYFMVMTATPIINNLVEAKKLMEMMHGQKYDELSTRNNSVKAGLEFHKHVVINGIRYEHAPRTKHGELMDEPNRIEVEIDGSDLLERLKWVNTDLDIEQIQINHKLEGVRPYIRKGTMIFTYYVEGIVDVVRDYCEALGFKCGLYTGRQSTVEREQVKEKFQEGKLDIIIGSLPIGTGVDGFQEVCDRLICLGLPWTHSEYEQLVGRIHRQGSPHKQVDVIIPKVSVGYEEDGVKKTWSRDRHKLNIIKFKRDLFGIVVNGVIPDGIVSNLDAVKNRTINSLNSIIEKVEKGEINVLNREEIEKEFLEHQEVDSYRRKVSSFGEMNKKWNTQKSGTTFDKIKSDPSEWKEYHRRYRAVRENWSDDETPYKVIGKKINKLGKTHLVVGDFGCGENLLRGEIENEIKAFDMHAIDDTVTVADITNLPLEDDVLQIGVFSISLMGRNYKEALREAKRVVVAGGSLFVCEPLMRWENRENGYEELRTEIEAEGFKVTDIYVEGSFVYVDAVNAL